jgi:methylmalonyl-CoA mutase C-terminal domain/subunit
MPREQRSFKLSFTGKRILMGKPDLDGHGIGAKVIALALRDVEADMTYMGLRKSREYVPRLTVDEDIDAVGRGIPSGSDTELVRRHEGGTIKVFVGETITVEDYEQLKTFGVASIFVARMEFKDVVRTIELERS